MWMARASPMPWPARRMTLTLADLCRALRCLFYIGGTKCGALFGEAIVVPKPDFIPHFFTIIKQHGALFAKGRLLGINLTPCSRIICMRPLGTPPSRLADQIRQALIQNGYQLCFGSPTNQIFCVMENAVMEQLAGQVEFGFWEAYDDSHTIIRFATSWATSPEQVEMLCRLLAAQHA